MKTIAIILLVALMVMVVVSLVRGIVAFMQSTKLDLEGGDERVKEMQLRQNKAMTARIKYQAAAVLVAMLLLALAS
ncbi:twin transmembrane helix small protein [Croceicoccus sp. BE223]|uniref:twin transmembrane helix small protein n=1 Tax=Croceicoccus sp. BE223 TaxID=2817716 RepID=UPI00286403C1|nr:twin transmembrane helix small protein [Croceicoccus sp. BE223]MDR7100944.1 flagellar basal body-associated protein FliL [Croceicoccus sp. BE223]